jgi:hypothetical protein
MLALTSGLSIAPAAARAAWIPNGTPVSTAPGSQSITGMIQDGARGALIVWSDDRSGSSAPYAERLTADGGIAPGWQVDGVRLRQGSATQWAVTDGDGGAIILVLSGGGLYAERIGADGRLLWPSETPVCPVFTTGQGGPSMISDGAGGAFIAWMDVRNSPPPDFPHHHYLYDIFAQRIDGSGARMWPDSGVAVCVTPEDQGYPRLVPDGQGGVIAAWQDGRAIAYAQRLDATGAPLWAANGVSVSDVRGGFAISDDVGGALFAWNDARFLSEDIFVQRIDGSGANLYTPGGLLVCRAPLSQLLSSIVSDGAGGMLMIWEDTRDLVYWYDVHLYMQHVTSAGTIAAGWPSTGLRVGRAPYFQITPQMVSDGAGGAVIAWCDYRTGVDDDIYAQRITYQGAPAAGWPVAGIPICTAPGHQTSPSLVADGTGGAIVAWNDARGGGDIYAQRIGPDGTLGCPTVATTFELNPNTLNLGSMGHWVTATIEPEPPASPADIDVASVRLNGGVPVDASAPTSVGDVDHDGRPDLTLKFDRAAVEVTVEEGDAVPVTVTGAIGTGCFEATDLIRVRRGHVLAPIAGSVLQGGSTTEVRWETPAGLQIQSVAVLFSSDDGATWNLVAQDLANTGSYLWTVPSAGADQARIAVVLVESADQSGYEVDGVLGVSDRFIVSPLLGVGGATLRFALQGAVPNPSRGLNVNFSLANAEPATLAVFDVSGREVSVYQVGSLGAGRHSVSVGGVSGTLAPGVYLVHLVQGSHQYVTRAILIQ